MKKLFASLLAATMVAGMAVSAFAYDTNLQSLTKLDADADYTFANEVYDKKGNTVSADATVLNDTTLYYPIIGINKDDAPALLTKASETDDLSVRLKDVRNGKYLKDPKIVKVDPDGNDATVEVGRFVFTNSASSASGTVKFENVLKTGDLILPVTQTAASDATEIAKTVKEIAAGINRQKTSMYTAYADGANLYLVAKEGGLKSSSPTFTDVSTTSGTVAGAYSNDATSDLRAGQNDGTNIKEEIYCVEVKVADYYQTEAGELEFELELKNKGRLETTSKDTTLATSFTIGKDADSTEDMEKKDEVKINLGIKANNHKPYEFRKTVDNIVILGEKAFPFEYEVKAAEQGEIFIDVDKKISKDIVVANPDAELEFLTFNGTPEFDFTGTLKYFVNDDTKEWYMYEIVDGKPVATDAKYNKEDACFELRTRKLGKYVVSDKALVLGAEEKPADKPAEEKPATTDKVVGTGALA